MAKQQTVVVNGRAYDAHTGLPVATTPAKEVKTAKSPRSALRAAKPTSSPKSKAVHPVAHSAKSVHTKTQRSHTLNRKYLKKATPAAKKQITPDIAPAAQVTQPKQKISVRNSAVHTPAPAQRPLMSRKTMHTITPAPIAAAPAPRKTPAVMMDITPAAHHPAVDRATTVQKERRTATTTKALPAASVIKQAAVNEALAHAPKHHAKQYKHAPSRKMQLTGIVCGCLALLLFGGYLTYLNVPNLSVKVAAAQAGIDASYPSYHPDGYKLNGPVAYSKGEVRMQFAANTGSNTFTLRQSRSNWDSSALLENYVKRTYSAYDAIQDRGLTIYNHEGNAAWVSGGILYTIDGDAPLSPDQIRKIATSV